MVISVFPSPRSPFLSPIRASTRSTSSAKIISRRWMILLRDFHLSRHTDSRATVLYNYLYPIHGSYRESRWTIGATFDWFYFRRREDLEYFHSLKQSFRWFHESREISWEKFCAIFDVNILRIIERKELERKFCSKGKGSVGRRMKI